MEYLLLVLTFSLIAFVAYAEECPDINSPHGAGFYCAAIEINGNGALILKDDVCKIGSPKVKSETEVIKCRSGYYAAMEKKSFALQCFAELQEREQQEKEK